MKRLLFLHDGTSYYQDMMEAFQKAAIRAGIPARCAIGPTSMSQDALSVNALEAIKAWNPTDVVGINNDGAWCPVRYHRWAQDRYDAEGESRMPDKSWSWVKAWEPEYGPWLPPAAEPTPPTAIPKTVDVGFIGFIPGRIPYFHKDPLGEELLKNLTKRLLVTRNFLSDRPHAEALLREVYAERGWRHDRFPEHVVWSLRSQLLRYVARKSIVDKLMEICARRGWTYRVWGAGWQDIYPGRPEFVGHVRHGPELSAAYASCKVHLHHCAATNIHTRVLESYLAGTPIMAEQNAGGEFERGFFTTGILPTYATWEEMEQGLAWLIDHPGVAEGAAKAGAEVVRKHFTWDHNVKRLQGLT